jgi:hypothetical protein
MSISATSNYMSNADIIAWMEQKTNEQYGLLDNSMDVANSRATEEQDLNDIDTLINNSKTDGGDAQKLYDAVNAAVDKYKDDPEAMKVLQPIQNQLKDAYDTAADDASTTTTVPSSGGSQLVAITPTSAPAPVIITDDQRDSWSKDIGAKINDLAKQDSLSMIDIQQVNSDINQAKQIAAALIDSADKTSSAIINQIA